MSATLVRCLFLNTAGANPMFGSCREGAVPSNETTGSGNARVGETAYVKTRQGETESESRQNTQGRIHNQCQKNENEVTLRDRSKAALIAIFYSILSTI